MAGQRAGKRAGEWADKQAGVRGGVWSTGSIFPLSWNLPCPAEAAAAAAAARRRVARRSTGSSVSGSERCNFAISLPPIRCDPRFRLLPPVRASVYSRHTCQELLVHIPPSWGDCVCAAGSSNRSRSSRSRGNGSASISRRRWFRERRWRDGEGRRLLRSPPPFPPLPTIPPWHAEG